MKFSFALFVALSASFVAAVPVSSPNEAAGAAYFEKAYSEKRSLKQDDAAGYWFSKGYEEERSPKEDGAAAFRDEMAYDDPK
ncbi:hypothetical protein N7517_011189 [Penicillium concentricum]|uniref:Uncharacterized protein n=1 Tax=Penicillium concentricum TaxID=293559 RepID=A0A9W9RBP7_9EURO|nr:uncharacterized protein N7517_011189 [Penicillium concentricum]KAJ5356580.1 hypothetical protein N7517_011189 [Penicillium concentricum]